MKIDSAAIKKLAALLDETGLNEIEVAEGDSKIRVKKQGDVAPASYAPVASAAPAGAAAPAAGSAPAANPNAVKSPMVGTCYLSPEPGAASFAKKGDSVSEGDTICIIEAMKVMNPIKATRNGVVKEILVRDAQPVEFGEPLMVIE